MKSIFTAAMFLSATISALDIDPSMISRDFKHFSIHFTPKSKALKMMNSRPKSRRNSVKTSTNKGNLEGEVSGYKVEFFQYISINEEDYAENITQFGTWYRNDVNNNTRTEIVTYSLFNAGSGDRYYTTPSEYLEIDNVLYQILEADSQYVYCQTDSPFPEENLDYEELGYAFVVPPEEAYPIIWGPRLIRVFYDPSTDENTVAYYGNDAFNGEPVITVQYNTTYEQSFVWSKIHEEDLESTDFDVPTDLTCSSTSTDSNNDNNVGVSHEMPWHDGAALKVLRTHPWN